MTALAPATQRWHLAGLPTVAALAHIVELGVSRSTVRAHVRAGRWQRVGRVVVTHNHDLARAEREQVALILCGPRSALTSFTGLANWGLTGWHRDRIHVLVPEGTRAPAFDGVTLHRVSEWAAADVVEARRLHRPAPALIIAAGSSVNVRTACGVLAAGVQQRLVTVPALMAALALQPKLRHQRALRLALQDMEQGAQALSEIDLVALCRRHGLPAPRHQRVRVEPSGRRRYLDAEWVRRDGGRLCAEVDGALHLEPISWTGDQLRQNEVVLGGTPVLRFPTIVIRGEPVLVADQLRRGLLL